MKFKIATSLFAAVLVLASVGCGETDPRLALYTGETSQLDEVALVGTRAKGDLAPLEKAGYIKTWKTLGDLGIVVTKRLECEIELSDKYFENYTEGVYCGSWESFYKVNMEHKLNHMIELNDWSNEDGQWDVFLEDVWVLRVLNGDAELPEMGDKTAFDKWKEKNCYAATRKQS